MPFTLTADGLLVPILYLRAKATLPTDDAELPASYDLNFGRFDDATLKIGGDKKEFWDAYNGGLGLAALRRIKTKFDYEFTIKKLSPEILAYLMGSASGSAPKPGKIVDLFFWAGLESDEEAVIEDDTASNDGEGILVHHSWKGALQIDGELGAKGDDFAGVKGMASVYLGVAPGLWTAGTRPITRVALPG